MPCCFFLEDIDTGSSNPSIVIPVTPSSKPLVPPPLPYPPASALPWPTWPMPHRRSTPQPPNQPVGLHSLDCPCHWCLVNHCLPWVVENLAVAENWSIVCLIALEIMVVLVRIWLTIQHLQGSWPNWATPGDSIGPEVLCAEAQSAQNLSLFY